MIHVNIRAVDAAMDPRARPVCEWIGWRLCVLENAPPEVLPLIDAVWLGETVALPFIEFGFVLFKTKLSVLDLVSVNVKASPALVLFVPDAFIRLMVSCQLSVVRCQSDWARGVGWLPLIEWLSSTEKLSEDDATPSMYVIVPESVRL